MGLAGASLVAAVPGGILAVVMLMAVLNSMERMPVLMKVAAILLLLIAAAVALFPAYVLIWYGPRKPRGAKSGTDAESTSAVATGDIHDSKDLVDEGVAAPEATGDEAWIDEGDPTQEFAGEGIPDSGEVETFGVGDEFDDQEVESDEMFDEEFAAEGDESEFDSEDEGEFDFEEFDEEEK